MADNDPNLADAADYDLVPVDHVPQFADAPVPKAGQTVAPPNVAGQLATIPSMVGKVAADVTGVSDAYRALSGQMTPEEQQQMFVMALPGLIPGARAETTAMKAAEEAAPAIARGIRAYHGSPYDFDQFDLSKIGTGEGAQAYGHGLYFAENPAVATDYKQSLSRTKPWEYEGKPVTQYSNDENIPYHVKQAVGWLEGNQRPGESVADLIQRRIKDLSDHAEFMRNSNNAADRSAAGMYDSAVDTLKRVDTNKLAAPTGKMYEVNINADPEHFLDWDKPLSEQSPKVQEAIEALGIKSGPQTMYQPLSESEWKSLLRDKYGVENLYDVPRDKWAEAQNLSHKPVTGHYDPRGQEIIEKLSGGDAHYSEDATEQLRDAGIPGIKYLDQGSRNNVLNLPDNPITREAKNYLGSPDVETALDRFRKNQAANNYRDWGRTERDQIESVIRDSFKPQTSNYVVFNDKLIDIVKKYGLAGVVGAGASHFQTVPVDHQPDFGDQQGVPGPGGQQKHGGAVGQQRATGGKVGDSGHKGPLESKRGDKSSAEKATKTQANYRGGTKDKRCGVCSMFVPPHGCSSVRGVISAMAVCDYFELKRQERANGGRVDAANIEHEPSEAQKEAGNYAKDHVRVHGLDISIENAKGHHRRGIGRDGKPWSVKMPAHYGYIKGTVGKDKDHVDVYLGPHLKSPNVFVVDQLDDETKKFDEHKAFIGFASPRQVVETYEKAFSDGKALQRLGHLTQMTVEGFKHWLATGDMKKKAAEDVGSREAA